MSNVADNSDLDKRLLAEYRVISSALERLEKGYESVEQNIALLQQRLPQTVRCVFLTTHRLRQVTKKQKKRLNLAGPTGLGIGPT